MKQRFWVFILGVPLFFLPVCQAWSSPPSKTDHKILCKYLISDVSKSLVLSYKCANRSCKAYVPNKKVCTRYKKKAWNTLKRFQIKWNKVQSALSWCNTYRYNFPSDQRFILENSLRILAARQKAKKGTFRCKD